MKRLLPICAILACTLAACEPEPATHSATLDARGFRAACEPLGGTHAGVPFSDEEASNAVDFLDHAALAELELLDGVGPVLAEDIAAMRPLVSLDDPLGELDAHPLIGERVLASLRELAPVQWCRLGDGRQSCCVDLGCDGLGTWVSGVPFSDEEAYATLEWANGGTIDQLEAVCGVGPAIAEEIVHARPLRSLHDLDAVPWVGPTALERMIGHGEVACVEPADVGSVWCSLEGACECAR